MASVYSVRFFDDPGEFLARAGDRLAADPVTSTVMAGVAARMQRSIERGDPPSGAPYSWFAVVTDGAERLVGVAMRTAPFEPYPVYLLDMPDDAARALARALLDRGEEVAAVNGALPAAQTFAEVVAGATGRTAAVAVHVRLFELGALEPPRPAPGRLRAAVADEVALALAWYQRFDVEADEQAGREAGHHDLGITEEDMRIRIRDGRVRLWVDERDRPVHLTGVGGPEYGVARIGPVYTPPEHRGHGYASAAVAEVSRQLLDVGARVTLFTDQANPVSNRIYLALGYRPVVDMVETVIG